MNHPNLLNDADDRSPGAISCELALQLLAEQRNDRQIFVSNQMTARIWPTISRHPLDLNYLSSTMGGAIPLGLGLALARPDYEVIVLTGDASLLMNLGCLATVVASRATNITIVVMDNGLYEVTGGQQTAGREANVNYALIAQATGFRYFESFDNIEQWRAFALSRWAVSGPRLISLRVHRVAVTTERFTATKVDVELRRLRKFLSKSRDDS